MKIISKRSHPYAGRERKPKAIYDATPDHARFLVAKGFAEYLPATSQPKPAAVVIPKDMTPETPATIPDTESKRVYKRKDLTTDK